MARPQNPFSLGETDDPATDIATATEEAAAAAAKAEKSAEESGQEAGEIVQESGGAEKAAGNSKERSVPLEDGPGFGAAGKDVDIKAAPVADKDDSLPEEYGAADDEFVTRTNYPPSEPEEKSFMDSAKAFVAGVAGGAGGDDVGPGTLVSLKNKIAGMDD